MTSAFQGISLIKIPAMLHSVEQMTIKRIARFWAACCKDTHSVFGNLLAWRRYAGIVFHIVTQKSKNYKSGGENRLYYAEKKCIIKHM
ncbi:hypothetical protein ANACOL_00643 [Anaerotruncus colihominis DSM 17241]|uniref:Uncharacterized protein n=1 Tax=Anaerotruncus colihominis DSM 17241 TaxID=445972 RepID=B0P7B3_9FIRM|nr:hypothetical protein ANACOL_00643 [Anaerotruncus colihominis DSM 17241]